MKIFSHRTGVLELGHRTYLMGVVNVTPDSFSDGGKYLACGDAVAHAEELIADGADLIDLGACSTRPFSEPVSPEEEIARLLPVIKELKKRTSVPLSVDTFVPSVAAAALEAGADIINDVGGVFDADMAELIRDVQAGYIVMHGGVKLAPSQTERQYPFGVTQDVGMFFEEMSYRLQWSRVDESSICFDPGFGFMKNTAQNAELLRGLSSLNVKDNALLIGLSRKRFVGELSGDPDASDRLGGTLAANVMAARAGADIIRTHEIRLHKKALAFADAIGR